MYLKCQSLQQNKIIIHCHMREDLGHLGTESIKCIPNAVKLTISFITMPEITK